MGSIYRLGTTLAKGELEYVVETDQAGELKVCFVQLEDLFSGWTSHTVVRGVVYRSTVVDGQRYRLVSKVEQQADSAAGHPRVVGCLCDGVSLDGR